MPEQYYGSLQVNSYDDVFKSVSPQLSGLKKELGEQKLKAILTLIIVDVVRFFNVGKTMDSVQVQQTIQLIIQKYWMLKPDDFKLCFTAAKAGNYGKVYDRIDGMILLEWLEAYTSGRFIHAEGMSVRAHEKIRMNERTTSHNLMVAQKERDRVAREEEINTRAANSVPPVITPAN